MTRTPFPFRPVFFVILSLLLTPGANLAMGQMTSAKQPPAVTQIAPVAPDIIAITIRDGRVVQGGQIPYQAQAGDEIETSGEGDRKSHWLKRDGKVVGSLVEDQTVLTQLDRFEDKMSDLSWIPLPQSYTASSAGDSRYKDGKHPLTVWHKSKPCGLAKIGSWAFEMPVDHTIYLEFADPLKQGASYRIAFASDVLPSAEFTHDPSATVTPVIHLTQTGYHPDDGRKIAFVSCWMGDGGGLELQTPLSFKVIDDKSGDVALEGETRLSLDGSQPEDAYDKNYTGADVHLIDFSKLDHPGTYRIVLEGIGCSMPFELRDDIWEEVLFKNARGLYHQRSGIQHGPPYTEYRKPRDFHPDDGVVIYHSTCPLMDSGNGLNARGTDENNFGNLVAGKTDEIVQDAWGGYHDAGDWDRRIQHLRATRPFIEIMELFPGILDDVRLNLPESGNSIPDLLDEVLWNMECYRRMQTPEGGIRGGIESAEHPKPGETSWQESLPIMAYAPGMWSSFLYAGDAIRLSALLEPFDEELASVYRASALRAMSFAEKAYAGHDYDPLPYQVRDARNYAAAALFAQTGEENWNTIYLETNLLTSPGTPPSKWSSREENAGWDQADAAIVYARIDRPAVDRKAQETIRAIFAEHARQAIEQMNQTGFRWVKYDRWRPIGWGTTGATQACDLLRAHFLTDEESFLSAALDASQFTLGANPDNMSFTTGIGYRPPENAFVINPRLTNQPVAEGITVYGPTDPERGATQWWAPLLIEPDVYPEYLKWPANESYFDVYMAFPMNEFTVMQTIGPNCYVWAYLSAWHRDRSM